MKRWLGLVGTLASVGTLFFACGDGESETLCEPGAEVFCKCRGGFEGTKTCLDDGASFGECATPDGECPEIGGDGGSTGSEVTPICLAGSEVECECDNGDVGSKQCSEDGSTFGDCTVEGAACGSGSGDKLIYAQCADGGECTTGACAGYCTRTCEIFTDCYDEANELYGDCVTIGGQNQCAPYCLTLTQAECVDAYGATSACGGAVALDDAEIAFAVCADWGDELQGLPYGTLCDDTTGDILLFGVDGQFFTGECDLGADGVQNYCFDGACAKVCYEDVDCPEMNCSSNGSVVGCCETEPECN